jgi:Glycosyl hydrolases family 2, TIM barrel domain
MTLNADGCGMRNKINHDMTRRSRARRMVAAAATILMCFAVAKSPNAENLLRNSSFELATNRTTPDYWDLHHAAALRFRDLYAQYNLVDDPSAPVAGVRVLRITNSESDFPFLYLLSKRLDTAPPAGNYVFSVYVKADRPRSLLELAPAWELMDQKITRTVTTEWQRYSAEFRYDGSDKVWLGPMLNLPSRGTYWIAAPQFEAGSQPTPYAPAAEDVHLGMRTAAQRSAAATAVAALASATGFTPATRISAKFEFSMYTDESAARLKVSNASDSKFEGIAACSRPSSPSDKSALFSAPIALEQGQTAVLEVPLGGFAPGAYPCSVIGSGRSASAQLIVLPPNPLTVRINQFRNTLELNRSGYYIRGMMVGGYVPPDWYVSDVVDHGVNTLLVYPRSEANGDLHFEELDAVLRVTAKYGLKVIVGPPVAGPKNDSWKSVLDRFCDLVRRYRNSPVIIGWFVADEPYAPSLHKNDLIDLYDRVKAIDPYRLAFINWVSDDISSTVGVEPHGSLAASDLYSIDYYPFGFSKNTLEGYTLETIRALRTGAQAGRPGHSWLQLYGSLDAFREPTGDELNYMAYVNLIYGGNYSYWQTKSNAKPTWDRLGKINEEVRILANQLMLNPGASELKAPTLMGHYLYSAWKTKTDSYLIVLHVCSQTESFALDLKSIFGPKVSQVRTYFDDVSVDISGAMLNDSFNAYGTRVYKISEKK